MGKCNFIQRIYEDMLHVNDFHWYKISNICLILTNNVLCSHFCVVPETLLNVCFALTTYFFYDSIQAIYGSLIKTNVCFKSIISHFSANLTMKCWLTCFWDNKFRRILVVLYSILSFLLTRVWQFSLPLLVYDQLYESKLPKLKSLDNCQLD